MDRGETISTVFGAPRALIGMIHLGALPGTPKSQQTVARIAEGAVTEAVLYRDAGFHGLLMENMHDRPYLKGAVGPEIVAAMAIVGQEMQRTVSLPLGVQILAGANREAMAVAHACGAAFVRVEGYVFAHLADEGLLESDAGELLRYRRALNADAIRIFADIKKKHASHAVTADLDLVETAHAAEFSLADGLVVTGTVTGHAADPEEVRAVSAALGVPVLVGSGITAENLHLYAAADALIVGSSAKQGGVWSNPLDPGRLEALVRALEALPAQAPE
jgi:membrane complex biogenesis BtpA family protein